MPLTVHVDPEEVVEKTADGRGRIVLGSEYADQDVTLLIVSDRE